MALTFGLIFAWSSKRRMQMTAAKLTKFINTLVKIATLGKKRRVIKAEEKSKSFLLICRTIFKIWQIIQNF
ncbi:hypothetical protein KOY48_01630 [Candidatus Minimicrobia naudis]|uniref:Uncharacterized protein n=1 Tax=Candidatus Minimicrobia naudis TaxID=2841263 RepID=A0A8F1MD02_9BACT|nr:hypothetical protein KOY48_01630 [Candidatus Minimicrobia naudis]